MNFTAAATTLATVKAPSILSASSSATLLHICQVFIACVRWKIESLFTVDKIISLNEIHFHDYLYSHPIDTTEITNKIDKLKKTAAKRNKKWKNKQKLNKIKAKPIKKKTKCVKKKSNNIKRVKKTDELNY